MLEAVQEMLLRVVLQTARDDYETRRKRQREGIEIARRAGRYTGRKADAAQHRRIVALREAGQNGRAGRVQHRAGQAGNGAAPGQGSKK